MGLERPDFGVLQSAGMGYHFWWAGPDEKKVSLDTARLTIRSRRWIGFRLALPNVLFDVVMNAPNKMKLSDPLQTVEPFQEEQQECNAAIGSQRQQDFCRQGWWMCFRIWQIGGDVSRSFWSVD